MKMMKDIVCENLINLRKKFKMTQMELGNQVNFSDKAISRWEKGEVVPDIPTLERLANLYQVPITYFFEEHRANDKVKRISTNLIFIEILCVLFSWTLCCVLFAIFKTYYPESKSWLFILLAICLTCITVSLFNTKLYKVNWIFLSCWSVFTWIFITIIFCLLNQPDKFWTLYLIGIPIQAIVVTLFFLKINIKKGHSLK